MHSSTSALARYRSVRSAEAEDGTDPHRTIALLLGGVVERLRHACASIDKGDIGAKAQSITRAIDIVQGLRLALDHAAGGSIAAGLEAIYAHAEVRLVQANLDNDVTALREVASLFDDILSAWQAIPARLEAERNVRPAVGA